MGSAACFFIDICFFLFQSSIHLSLSPPPPPYLWYSAREITLVFDRGYYYGVSYGFYGIAVNI